MDMTQTYAVIACGKEWRVASRRAQIGRFLSRAGALAVAVGLVKQAAAEGYKVVLLAHDEQGDTALQPMFHSERKPPAR
jgi:hypothetical protein